MACIIKIEAIAEHSSLLVTRPGTPGLFLHCHTQVVIAARAHGVAHYNCSHLGSSSYVQSLGGTATLYTNLLTLSRVYAAQCGTTYDIYK